MTTKMRVIGLAMLLVALAGEAQAQGAWQARQSRSEMTDQREIEVWTNAVRPVEGTVQRVRPAPRTRSAWQGGLR